MTKKFAVILSGSGVYDGSEIHEATLSLLAIDKLGGTYTCFAPNVDQYHVINHLNGEVMAEKRNVLIESARIARGEVQDLKTYNANDFDALLIPGGFGAAKNLSTLAFEGANCSVNPEFEQAIVATAKAEKPIGALCISPAVITKILTGAKVTIGSDADTISVIETLGGTHEHTTHGQVVVDPNFKLVTTPCYMLDASISQIAQGADNVVKTLMEME